MPLRLRTLAELTTSPQAARPSKFHNLQTVVGSDTFASGAEARRWVELQHLQRAGEIRSLRKQVPFQLAPPVRYSGSARLTPALRYVADFVYEERIPTMELRALCCRKWQVGPCVGGGACKAPPPPEPVWREVVEDAKGALTDTFKVKRHLMLAILGIDVRLSRAR